MPTIPDDRFREVLRRHLKYLNDGPLDLDENLKSLGLDSMAAVNLLFDIEDEFDVTLPDEYLVEATFATGRSLHEALLSLKAAA